MLTDPISSTSTHPVDRIAQSTVNTRALLPTSPTVSICWTNFLAIFPDKSRRTSVYPNYNLTPCIVSINSILALPAISRIPITCSTVLACTVELTVRSVQPMGTCVRTNCAPPTMLTITPTVYVTAVESVRFVALTRVTASMTKSPRRAATLASKTRFILRVFKQ